MGLLWRLDGQASGYGRRALPQHMAWEAALDCVLLRHRTLCGRNAHPTAPTSTRRPAPPPRCATLCWTSAQQRPPCCRCVGAASRLVCLVLGAEAELKQGRDASKQDAFQGYQLRAVHLHRPVPPAFYALVPRASASRWSVGPMVPWTWPQSRSDHARFPQRGSAPSTRGAPGLPIIPVPVFVAVTTANILPRPRPRSTAGFPGWCPCWAAPPPCCATRPPGRCPTWPSRRIRA